MDGPDDGVARFDVHPAESRDVPHYVELRDVVLDTSTNLMSAEPDEFETKLRWGLESVGTEVDVDRGFVFRARNGGFERTDEWTAEGVDSWETRRLDLDDVPWLSERLGRFENAVVPRTDDLPSSAAATRDLLRSEGTGAAVFVPMVNDWSLDGFVGFDVVGAGRRWDDTAVDLLRTVGDMIGHSIARVRRERTLEEQNERLETFASVVSHDLRNPLNVVSGSVRLAREHDDPVHLDRAASAAERMETLIDQVLTLATEGREIGETAPTALDTVVEDAWRTVDTSDATLELDGSPGTFEVDAARLREAFENLFRNAVEHGGDDVTVRVGPLGGNSGFYVEDDGPGIPETARADVFDHGYTTDDGTGLGLAIVGNIVDAHGWSVSVHGGADGGARFEIDVQSADR
ncbi:MAG: sensor histidine kinase [Haloferacaceae archaeon]